MRATLSILFATNLIVSLQGQRLSELVKLPKDTLVEMAMVKLGKPPGYFVDFDRISVWSWPEAGRLDVIFDRHTNYLTRTKKCIRSVSAELISGVVGGETSGLRIAEFDDKKYYVFSPGQKKDIRFVKETLLRSDRYKGLLSASEKDGHLTIAENKRFFAITIEVSGSYFASLKIDRRSGKIYDASYMEMTLTPETPKRIRVY